MTRRRHWKIRPRRRQQAHPVPRGDRFARREGLRPGQAPPLSETRLAEESGGGCPSGAPARSEFLRSPERADPKTTHRPHGRSDEATGRTDPRTHTRPSPFLLPLLLTLALTALLGACAPADEGTEPATSPPTGLLIVSYDTVRQDRLSLYGFPEATSPILDALAAEGVVFDQAITQSTQTGPAHASFFTGLYPHGHGVEANGQVLPAGIPTLAEILRDAGWQTAAFVSGYTLRREVCGLERGFETYDDAFEGKRRPGAETAARAAAWLDGRDPERPFFLFLHLYDAHGPYLPPSPYDRMFPSDAEGTLPRIPRYQLVLEPGAASDADGEAAPRPVESLASYLTRYHGAIRWADDIAREVYARVPASTTALVALSDHGESLDERWWKLDHGGQVFEEQIRIPWMLRSPGLESGRVAAPVQGIDLTPTLLELLGVSPPEGFSPQGVSRLPLARGEAQRGARATFSTAYPHSVRHADRDLALSDRRPILTVRAERWKLISYPLLVEEAEGEAEAGDRAAASELETDPLGPSHLELYDLEADPGERQNVAAEHPDLVRELARTLAGWYRPTGRSLETESLDPEVREQLRALGYVG